MSILTATSHQVLYRELPSQKQQQQQQQRFLLQNPPPGSCWLDHGRGARIYKEEEKHLNKKKGSNRQEVKVAAFWDFGRPSSVEMVPIEDSDQLDRILLQAQERSIPILIDWMAAWCRKCIYLKPKLEKLAAEFDTKIQVYCVDVNKVPQALVKRGNVSKMPTIQIWKDGEFKEEVIGGHKAWLVVDEVREMIKKFV